jgi:CRP-like cAMP-binding protein
MGGYREDERGGCSLVAGCCKRSTVDGMMKIKIKKSQNRRSTPSNQNTHWFPLMGSRRPACSTLCAKLTSPRVKSLSRHLPRSTPSTGTSLGRLALMYGHPRAASVVAIKASTLWCFDRITFRANILYGTWHTAADYAAIVVIYGTKQNRRRPRQSGVR